jgi:hypothetical protein
MDVLTGGKQIVLNAYQTVNIERFVDSLNEGKKFKFISFEQGIRTGEIQDPSAPENGLIRVQIYPEVETTWTLTTSSAVQNTFAGPNIRGMLIGGAGGQSVNSGGHFYTANNCSTLDINSSGTGACMDFGFSDIKERALTDKGATAEGSHSSQQFREQSINWTTQTTPVTFDIWLRGPMSEVKPTYNPRVEKPIKIVLHQNGGYQVFIKGTLLVTLTSCSISGGKAHIRTSNGLHIDADDYELVTA